MSAAGTDSAAAAKASAKLGKALKQASVDLPEPGEWPEVPELMGVTEACKALGVQTSNLDKVAELPDPVQTLAAGRIWRAEEIRDFAEYRRSRRGL